MVETMMAMHSNLPSKHVTLLLDGIELHPEPTELGSLPGNLLLQLTVFGLDSSNLGLQSLRCFADRCARRVRYVRH